MIRWTVYQQHDDPTTAMTTDQQCDRGGGDRGGGVGLHNKAEVTQRANEPSRK